MCNPSQKSASSAAQFSSDHGVGHVATLGAGVGLAGCIKSPVAMVSCSGLQHPEVSGSDHRGRAACQCPALSTSRLRGNFHITAM